MAVSASKTNERPEPSALSQAISAHNTHSYRENLAVEIMHNLRYQHGWTKVKAHEIPTSAASTPPASDVNSDPPVSKPLKPDPITLISGLPPRHSYIHPDFQNHLIKNDLSETSIPIQREFVLPLSLGEKWSLRQFSSVFDSLDERDVLKGHEGFPWRDSKRIILGMLAHNGMGGDGTVAYYIMQEGEVKPRQHG